MEYKSEKKEAPGRGKVEVLGATYEEGKPCGEETGRWRQAVSRSARPCFFLHGCVRLPLPLF